MVEKKRDRDLEIITRAITTGEITGLSHEVRERMDRIEFISRLYFSKTFKFHSDMALARRVAQERDIPLQQARKDVELCKQLYVYANPVDWSFERALLIHSIKDNINRAREAGDLKTVQREHANLIALIGDKANDEAPQTLLINVVNYNPSLVGAKEIPDLEQKVQAMIEADMKEENEIWEDFDVVETNQRNDSKS